MKTGKTSGRRKNVPPACFLGMPVRFSLDARTGLYEMAVAGKPVCFVRTPEEGAITLREMFGAPPDGEEADHHERHGRNGGL